MADNYFGNLRTVGASLDTGISRLQEIWKMPHLLLCKNNPEDQEIAKKLLETLKAELKCLKDNIESSKSVIRTVREDYEKNIQEVTQNVDNLKDEIEDIKVLFKENGYVEPDLSNLDSQLELLSIKSSDSFLQVSSTNSIDNSQQEISFADPNTRHNSDGNTPTSIAPSLKKKMLLDQPPLEPLYSPYYHKIIKRQ